MELGVGRSLNYPSKRTWFLVHLIFFGIFWKKSTTFGIIWFSPRGDTLLHSLDSPLSKGKKTQRRTSERNWTSNFISVKWVALGWFLELRPRLPLNSMIAINLMKSLIMSSLSLNSMAQWKLPFHLEFVSKGFILLFFSCFLTIQITIAIPETILGNRFSSGKCGSKSPVTGFLSTAGANAAKVGRGLS